MTTSTFAYNNYLQCTLSLQKDLHHETLSLLLFKKILLDNTKVLYLFVESKMSVDEVKMIEKMIVPKLREPKVGRDLNNNDSFQYAKCRFMTIKGFFMRYIRTYALKHSLS